MVYDKRIYITDLSDPSFHCRKVVEQLKQGFFVASLITKRPLGVIPILKALPAVDRRISVQVTVTGLGGTVWEPRVQPAREVFRDIPRLFEYLSRDQVSLRYDPIIPGVNDKDSWFRAYVARCQELGIARVTVSILDVYKHVRERIAKAGIKVNLPEGFSYPLEVRKQILDRWLAAAEGKVETRVCCEPGLEKFQRGGCDWVVEAIERLTGRPYQEGDLPKGTQRKSCGCPLMYQLLSYADKCPHGCLYCYRQDR